MLMGFYLVFGFSNYVDGLVSIMVGSNCPTLTEMAIHLNSCHT